MENFEKQYQARKDREEERAAKRVAAMTRAGRQNELFKASANAEYRELLYKEFGLS